MALAQGGSNVPHYLIQVAYTSEGWAALAKNPQDRIAAVTPAVEKAGGKIESAYYAFGDYDVVVVCEFPDNASAAGMAISFAAGGTLKGVKTTPLLTPQEALEAMKKAGGTGYQPAR
jgi:uncharacterized protein with GYD domain